MLTCEKKGREGAPTGLADRFVGQQGAKGVAQTASEEFRDKC
jgi:hypothetical protein